MKLIEGFNPTEAKDAKGERAGFYKTGPHVYQYVRLADDTWMLTHRVDNGPVTILADQATAQKCYREVRLHIKRSAT